MNNQLHNQNKPFAGATLRKESVDKPLVNGSFIMKKILAKQNHFILVDEEDYELLKSFKWRILKGNTTFYAQTDIRLNGYTKTVYMHRIITGDISGFDVDHIDGNGLNNQKNNLRVCTRQQNQMNRKKSTGKTSKYKGVYMKKRDGFFYATIKINKKPIWIGSYKTEQEAALAYDIKAKELFGDYAKLNMPIF